MRKAFQNLDTSHSSTVSAEEFEQGLAKMGVSVEPEEARRLIRRFGRGGSSVRFHQFVRLCHDVVDLAA